MTPSGDHLTTLLNRLGRGEHDPALRDRLFDLVRVELERAARGVLRRAGDDRGLETVDLVNEVYLRLLARPGGAATADGPRYQDRKHFYCTAARVMRHLRVDEARRRRAQRLDTGDAVADARQEEARRREEELLQLDDALTALAAVDPQAAEVAELRLFGGRGPGGAAGQPVRAMPMETVVAVLGCSPATAYRAWDRARAWLRDKAGVAEDER
jgi:RNA polymerase sigma factor (TIGR02999 family)